MAVVASSGGIFVSYRRRDNSGLTGRIADRLRNRFGDPRVFFDAVSMSPGRDFLKEIATAVAGCDAMLVIIGAAWLTAFRRDERGKPLDDPDDIVALEVEAGLARDDIPVIPVLLDGIEMPQPEELPPAIRELVGRHWLRVDHESFEQDVQGLLEALARYTAPVAGTAGRPPAQVDPGDDDGPALRSLARAVGIRCRSEASAARLDRAPLPISWSVVDPEQVEERWSRIRRDRRDEPLALDGSTPGGGGARDITAAVRCAEHHGRVVIVGDAGAGKTALALQLTLDLLAEWERDESRPVPVFLRLSTWDPRRRGTRELATWMSERMRLEHGISLRRPPGPGPRGVVTSGAAAVADLLRQGRLLPVLDGLDEVHPRRVDDVVEALTRSLGDGWPVVVTCRRSDYLAAAKRTGEAVVGKAVTLAVRPLNATTVRDHLLQACGSTARSEAITTVLERDRRSGRKAIIEVLRTPLYASLARVAYAENPGDLTKLLGLRPQQVRDELLDQIIPAAYPDPPDDGLEGLSYDRSDVKRWLTRLARHLRDNRGGSRDIAWWELFSAINPLLRTVAVIIVAGSVLVACGYLAVGRIGVAGGLMAVTVFHCTGGSTGLARPWGNRWMLRRSAGAVSRPPGGFFMRPIRWLAVAAVVVALVGWAVGRQDGPQTAVVRVAVVLGVAVVGFLLLVLLLAEFTTVLSPGDVVRAVDPDSMLRSERWNVLVFGPFAAALVLAGVYPAYLVALHLFPAALAGVSPPVSTRQWLVLGAAFLLVAALTMTAWSRFQIARVYLVVVRGLPWRSMTFLHDAQRRGVLRQVGGCYQFRHASLQDRLAPPRPDGVRR